MRPETPVWGRGASCAFCVPGLLGVQGTFVLGMFGAFGVFGAFLCPRCVFLGLRCADAGHPPGLFAE